MSVGGLCLVVGSETHCGGSSCVALGVGASAPAARGLWSTDSVAVAHGCSRSAA